MLSRLVYEAAESDAQQFIRMIFNSSAGKVVFNAYKNNSTLPEVIAKDHGNNETANYLEDINKRYICYNIKEKLKITCKLKIHL